MLSTPKHSPDFARKITRFCLPQIIRQRLAEIPEAVAILAPGRPSMNNRQLAALTGNFHRHLRACGIAGLDRVAVMLPSSPELATAFLAIAGCAACVPIPPNLTTDEAVNRLAATHAKALVTAPGINPEIVSQAQRQGMKIIHLTLSPTSPAGWFEWDKGAIAGDSDSMSEPAENDVALVLPTSGTTGQPKWASLTQYTICHLVCRTAESLELSAQDCCLNMLPLFHVHGLVSALIMPLAAGGSVVITGTFRPQDFGGWLETFQPTWYSASPTMHLAMLELQRIHPSPLGRLRFIRSGSAPLTTRLADELAATFKVPVIEAYGMTEVPQITGNPLHRRKAGSVGKSIGHELAIMSETGGLLPSGQVGEVVLRGEAVQAGHESASPQSIPVHNGGWFHTGDQGWLDADGFLFLTGRIKEIINRGGHKISPREIDEVLLAHPQVREAVAFAVPHVTLGEDVAAAVVPKPGYSLSEGELRKFVAQHLSDFKVPSRVVMVEAIPLGSTGKVQRRCLAERLAGQLTVAYEPPAADLEQLVAEVFQQTLHLPRPVGQHDNFFLLGGDSLLGMRAMAKLSKALTRQIPTTILFGNPTVAGLAESLAAMIEKPRLNQEMPLTDKQDHPSAEPVSGPEVYVFPLSFAQQRLWFLTQFEGASAAYNMTGAVRLNGELNQPALERALNEIVARHDSLRTHFTEVDGQPSQVVVSALKITLPVEDLSVLAVAEREAAVATVMQRESNQPFNLHESPLLRLVLVKLGEREHLLIRTFHHIVSDGWSVGVFNRELSALYAAFRQSQPSPLEPLPIQYPDYTLWQRQWLQGDELDRQVDYWRKQLADAPTLELPTDRPRSTQQTYVGAAHAFTISPTLSFQLKELNRREKSTPFMSLLAVFQVLLARYSGQPEVLVGIPIANRQKPELENLIGFFVNTLVIRTNLADDSSFQAVVAQVRKTALDAYEHQDLPFEKLVEELNPERDPSRHPIFQVVFALQNTPAHPLALAGLETETCSHATNLTHFDLELHIWPNGGSWTGAFSYNTDLFNPATIERLAGHYLALLEAMLAEPHRPVLQVPMLSAAERQQMVVEWNRTEREYPQDKCIHQLFEVQAKQTPDAVAVVFQSETLNYRQLNDQADRLAQHLRLQGVGPDVLVGLSIERSVEMIIGVLGILKAGGAYWALEENLPEDRLQAMLADAQPRLLLARRTSCQHLAKLAGKIPGKMPPVLVVEDLLAAAPGKPIPDQPANQATDWAYVSYTSGSTGQPKGVVVPHRGVVRLVKNTGYVTLSAEDALLHLSPLSFDASTFEIWGGLLNGGRVVILPPGPPALAEIGEAIRRNKVTTLWLTAGLFHLMVDDGLEHLKPLRQLLAGGDVLSPDHVRRAHCALPGCRIINGYGPTENTTFTCCYPVTDERDLTPSVPIGRPIANTQVYVLDRFRQPVPVGVVGELYAGGDGVACGYLRQPQLTAERFIPDPFSRKPGARLYRTGDRVRWRPDGTLEFCGRNDSQVKIRGFRIEVGEIEVLLEAQPEVGEAIVVVGKDQPGNQRLLAYLVAKSGEKPDGLIMRQRLAEKLPDYMLPGVFVWLDHLPLNQNGKVDRKALPAPEMNSDHAGGEDSQPVSLLELELVRIWQRLFQRNDIRREDNFFSLGGHSLLAARLAAEIDKLFGCKLPIATLFHSPTIESLARRLADEKWVPAWSALVPLQPHGSKPPLFFVHGWGGDVYGFLELVKLLPPDQPSYGIQAVGLDGKAPRHNTVEAMAAHYMQEIISFQPTGDIYLAGYSMGGVIAYEVAQQLHRNGRRVALLGVMDSSPLGEVHWGFQVLCGADFFSRRCWHHIWQWWHLPFRERLNYVWGRLAALRHWVVRKNSRPPLVTSPVSSNPALPPTRYDTDYYHSVAIDYQCRPYPGAAYIFTSDDSEVGWRWFWRYMVRGGVTFHKIKGDHFQILLSPEYLPGLANALTQALRHAQTRKSTLHSDRE